MEGLMEQHINGIGWIEIGTEDPDSAQRFYGGMFGWSFGHDGGERDYRELTTEPGAPPSGGLNNHDGTAANYAIFYVKVADVEAALARAGQLGGKTLVPSTPGGDGLIFAHLTDPGGNHFGVYSEPAR
jgi:predicted enzyme related to lactoylglutathione lyase